VNVKGGEERKTLCKVSKVRARHGGQDEDKDIQLTIN
jgi:hypothetical protein